MVFGPNLIQNQLERHPGATQIYPGRVSACGEPSRPNLDQLLYLLLFLAETCTNKIQHV